MRYFLKMEIMSVLQNSVSAFLFSLSLSLSLSLSFSLLSHFLLLSEKNEKIPLWITNLATSHTSLFSNSLD